MKEKIISLLKAHKEIGSWDLTVNREERDELYLIFDTVEQKRRIEEILYHVEVLVHKEKEGKRFTGSARFQALPGESEQEIRQKIDDAILAASLALNPYYDYDEFIPAKEKSETCDPLIRSDRARAMDDMKEKIFAMMKENRDVRLASAEIFLTLTRQERFNSKGLSHTSEKSEALLEAVFLTGTGENEVESVLTREERFIKNIDLENVMQKYMGFARDNLKAQLPKTGKYDVIFTEEALDEFFDFYTSQLNASMKFNKMSVFNPGDAIAHEFSGDKLSLSFNPRIPGGYRSMDYDRYGTLVQRTQVIEDGIVKGFAADRKYATYLEMPCTGSPGNTEVKCGTRSLSDLETEGTYVLSRFSTFSPNPLTGAFSGEIRNGYVIKDGKRIPVKGGSVTGMMKEAMSRVFFSSEEVIRRDYKGPEYIKVLQVDIAGE